MQIPLYAIVLTTILVTIIIFGLSYKIIKNSVFFKKYRDIDDEEQHLISLKKEISDLRKEENFISNKINSLKNEASIYDEEIEMAEMGHYKPYFDFGTSEKFKEQIRRIKDLQKKLISEKVAIVCRTEWAVEGSKAKGRTMTNQLIRLTARAFNNECDSAISSCTWKNVDRLEARIKKAFEAINKLNKSNQIDITGSYLDSKIQELRLTYEYKEKLQAEKEEQAEFQRQIREEQQLTKEAEQAAKEEEKYQKMLDKAKSDAEKASGDKHDKLMEEIAKLELELKDAQDKNTRAKSMAQQTRSGHVYVISNVGSFGEGVYKIGMTRRLEPMDRVKELGDASVPFLFDVHAMIKTDDAPALEKSLHDRFVKDRLNRVNMRKEFFRIDLKDIESAIHENHPNADIEFSIEAREYLETRKILENEKR